MTYETNHEMSFMVHSMDHGHGSDLNFHGKVVGANSSELCRYFFLFL